MRIESHHSRSEGYSRSGNIKEAIKKLDRAEQAQKDEAKSREVAPALLRAQEARKAERSIGRHLDARA